MAKISNNKIDLVKNLYYGEKLTMNKIAQKLGVSIDAVVYCMRKNGIKRRSLVEANAIAFQNKKLSFREQTRLSSSQEQLKLAGLMLYWSEGHKSSTSSGIDFANSDADMIAIFVKFLREIYKVDEKRFRILLYCYSDQNVFKLIDFWSRLTRISKKQFSKPYIRKDFCKNSRKMKYGMIHIRYADKKLFLCIMKSIEETKLEMRRSDSGYSSGL
ncbi:MAG: hypothetical protein AAB913_01510 [Patescibacteria group bacterium]